MGGADLDGAKLYGLVVKEKKPMLIMFSEDVIVEAGGNTHWHYIHAAAKRKAKRLFARCRNVVEYVGIMHSKTETISDNPVRCRFHCIFNVLDTLRS